MRRFVVLVLAAVSLPTGARALPMLVAEATATSEDTVEISLAVRGVDPDEPIGAVEVRIPTDASGYDVIGGKVLDPTAGALGDLWSAVWGTTARFRPAEDDFFMSLFSPSASVDTDFEFALLTLRIIEPEAPVVLDPGSTIARLTDHGVQSTDLAGQVIYGDPARVEILPPIAQPPPPPIADPLPPPPDEPLEAEPLPPPPDEPVGAEPFPPPFTDPVMAPPDEPVTEPSVKDVPESEHTTNAVEDLLPIDPGDLFVCASEDACDPIIDLFEIVFVGDTQFAVLTSSKDSSTSNSVGDSPAIAMPEPRSGLLLALGLLALICARSRTLAGRP